MTPWEKSAQFGIPEPSPANYTDRPVVDIPVLPMKIWALAYDLDLVVVSRHPSIGMHEYARIQTPEGPLWLVKDADRATGTQTIVADHDGVQSMLPEVPVERKHWPVQVIDNSTEDWLALSFEYESFGGEKIRAQYRGRPPVSAQKKRSGSTMGHSRQWLLAVLDLSHRDFGRYSRIEVEDQHYPTRKLLGLVPFHMALQQTQGGLATSHFVQRAVESENLAPEAETVAPEAETVGSTLTDFDVDYHLPGGLETTRRWHVRREGETVVAEQRSALRTLSYQWLEGNGSLELIGMTVRQYLRETPTCHIRIQPALADLRRPFEGVIESRFVIDVNGQEGLAIGRIQAWWSEQGPQVRVIPDAPRWTVDRPMLSTVRYGPKGVEVSIERIPDLKE